MKAARQLCEKLGLKDDLELEEKRKWEEFGRKSMASVEALTQENADLFKRGICSFSMDSGGSWLARKTS